MLLRHPARAPMLAVLTQLAGCITESGPTDCAKLARRLHVGAESNVEMVVSGVSTRFAIEPSVLLSPTAKCVITGTDTVTTTPIFAVQCPGDWQVQAELTLGDLRMRGEGTVAARGADVALTVRLLHPGAGKQCTLEASNQSVTVVTTGKGGPAAVPAFVTGDYARTVVTTLRLVGKSATMSPAGVCPDFEATVTLRLDETAADWKSTPKACDPID